MRHDLRDGSREVAVYEVSELGRAEFRRLLEEALTEVRPTAPLAFQTAFSMLPHISRADALALARANGWRTWTPLPRRAWPMRPPTENSPPHVLAMVDYWDRVAKVERDWLVRLIFRIGDGGLAFLDEPMDWTPAPDDPGHQMKDDRERYLALLGR